MEKFFSLEEPFPCILEEASEVCMDSEWQRIEANGCTQWMYTMVN